MEELILTRGSYFAIVLVLALSGAGLPIPEEVTVVAAGVLSSPSVDKMDAMLAFLACLAGALIGDSVMYGIGRFVGRSGLRQHPWVQKILHAERERQMETLIQNYGLRVFFLARFLIGIRSPIYLAAGMLRIPYTRFLFVDGVCALIVVGTFFWASYFSGSWIAELVHQSQLVFTAVALLVAISAALYFGLRKLKSRAASMLDENAAANVKDVSAVG